MLTKEKPAEAARNEVADHIRAHPGAWITEKAGQSAYDSIIGHPGII